MRFTLEVFFSVLPEVANDNYVAQFEAVKNFSSSMRAARVEVARNFLYTIFPENKEFSLKIKSFPIVSKLPIVYHLPSFTKTWYSQGSFINDRNGDNKNLPVAYKDIK